MAASGSEHWSEYWAQGRLTSLPQDFAANYDGEVADFWNEAFAGVPDEGHVLDLCTGNGAIALLAASYFDGSASRARITAVDAAEMNPAAVEQHFPGQSRLVQNIDFIANCKVEDLQIHDESADLVTSQYGIEYCNWVQAAGQVARVLKPGGRFLIVCHTPTSDMLAYMNREHAEYARLEELGFFAVIDEYLAQASDSETILKAFTAIKSELEPEFASTGSALYRSVLGLVHGALNLTGEQLDNHREPLRTYQRQMQAGKNRLADMLRVNQALSDDPDWTSVFERAGLQPIREGQIKYRGQHNAGQFYEFSKPKDGANKAPDG